VIDGPIVTADSTELMVFAQRLPARDGSFDGIARAAVTTDRLRALLARAVGADDPAVAATLLRDDGTIVMRTGRARAGGLAAVHGIVTRHRGQIRVDSAPGAGTAFSIYQPLAVEARQAA
jgi:nitrogen-specific signal transduction histidine kinase